MSPTILLSAGGTGGHLFPAQATATSLVARGADVVLATDRRGAAYPMPDAVRREVIDSAPPVGNIATKIIALTKMAWAAAKAGRTLSRIKPDLVVGFGGYPSIPAVLAAQRMGIPTVIHEQNGKLGRANAFLAGKATVIATGMTSLTGAPDGKPTVFIGNPIRQAILDRAGTYETVQPKGPVRLLVFGGSQGARAFSTIVPDALKLLDKDIQDRLVITQQARPEDLENLRQTYADIGLQARVEAFFEDMPTLYREAHFIISRSGASTCAELCASGRPAILIPFPFAVGDHQTANAQVLTDAKAALLRPQVGLSENMLARDIVGFISDPGRLAAMAANAQMIAKTDAADSFSDLLLTSIAKGEAA